MSISICWILSTRDFLICTLNDVNVEENLSSFVFVNVVDVDEEVAVVRTEFMLTPTLSLFMIVARVSTIVDDGGAVVGFMFDGVQNQ